jgi:Ca2+-binding RTX toxin-like protein
MFTKKQARNAFSSNLEQLESRRLLSSVDLVGGVLTVLGSQNKDDITISLRVGNTSQLSVTLNDAVSNFNVSAIDSIFVYGRMGDDTILVSNVNGVVPFAMFLGGGADKDVIVGGNFDDTLRGGDNDDVLTGGRGNDSLAGDDANDILTGSVGDDYLFGGPGNDEVFGNGGADYLKGGADNDRLFGGNDNDELWGNEGNDSLMGGDGNDFLVGGQDDDDLDGQAGSDELYGQIGNDDFFGDADEVQDLAATDNGSNDVTA